MSSTSDDMVWIDILAPPVTSQNKRLNNIANVVYMEEVVSENLLKELLSRNEDGGEQDDVAESQEGIEGVL